MSNFIKVNPHKNIGIYPNWFIVAEVDAIIISYYYRFFYTICTNYEYFRYAVRYLEDEKIDEFLAIDIT